MGFVVSTLVALFSPERAAAAWLWKRNQRVGALHETIRQQPVGWVAEGGRGLLNDDVAVDRGDQLQSPGPRSIR